MRFKKGDLLMVSDIQTSRIGSAQSLLVLIACTGKNFEKHPSLICLLFNYVSLLTSYDRVADISLQGLTKFLLTSKIMVILLY